ncbi:glycine zipper 2TM protein [Sphingomonas sp. PP-CE-1A-559]|uniref:RcnB family protein n=1 Tax=Sphingomonas sp. PP-CE-1A-559 TaxID=2135657 RepID=UPI00105534DD|nr:RcnB family protein [Sphingomonas sp. PP-CE-1A-559]TCP94016.1 glycine zipper 2TM protein [Sphingomonas sp. PP-CE-1A-559]
MRRLLIASAGLVLAGGVADAQRPGASYPAPGTAPGAGMQAPMARPGRPGPIAAQTPVVQAPIRPVVAPRSARWGSKIGGRWWAGANAPGGWAGYRRPHRGWAVPAYWNAPRFYVGDWSNYGLAQPPQGYNWTRYYDDAVLIDARGSVYDTTSDIDWDRAGGSGYVAADPRAYARNDEVYSAPSDRGYVTPYADRPAPRRDTGLGGAAIGAVAGGVAGNVIGGRGNRLGGTLIGTGLGAAAGYAIDKAEDRGRPAPPPPVPGYGAGYAAPSYVNDYSPPPPSYDAGYPQPRSHVVAPGGSWTSPDGLTTVTTTSGQAYPTGSTTVVVQSVPVTTTTTTTEYYDTVLYPRKKLRRRR